MNTEELILFYRWGIEGQKGWLFIITHGQIVNLIDSKFDMELLSLMSLLGFWSNKIVKLCGQRVMKPIQI